MLGAIPWSSALQFESWAVFSASPLSFYEESEGRRVGSVQYAVVLPAGAAVGIGYLPAIQAVAGSPVSAWHECPVRLSSIICCLSAFFRGVGNPPWEAGR